MLITEFLEIQMQEYKTENFLIQSSHPVILIVDDDAPIRTLLRHLMEEENYRVIEACNGEEAVTIYQNCRVDLVLLDGTMPKMNGFTCCQYLSTSSYNPGVPIVMLTSLSDDESIDRAFAAGATDYLTKPFNWILLRQRVRHLLQMHQINAELQRQSQRSLMFKTIAQCISRSPNSETVLSIAVAETRRLLQVDRVLVYRFNPDRSGVVCAESSGSQCQALLGQAIKDPCFASQFDQLYRVGHIQVIEDLDHSNLPACYIDLLQQFQVKAIMVVPILLQGHVWGFLITHHCTSPRHWQVWEVELIEYLAAQLSIAIQQIKFYQHVQQFSAELKHYVQDCSSQISKSSLSSYSGSELESGWQHVIDRSYNLLDEGQRSLTAIQESNWLTTFWRGLREC